MNCDIMFLARRDGKTRLMSFKSNPWFDFDHVEDYWDDDYEGLYKHAIFLFSGILAEKIDSKQD